VSKSRLESRAEIQLQQEGLAPFAREFRWHPSRRWRFDFAFPDRMVAYEIEGATWTGGRHSFGGGFRDDAIKYAEAAIAGWIVIRASADMIRDRTALHLVKRALSAREGFNALPLFAHQSVAGGREGAGELRPAYIRAASGAPGPSPETYAASPEQPPF
jgi:hypothetical protein